MTRGNPMVLAARRAEEALEATGPEPVSLREAALRDALKRLLDLGAEYKWAVSPEERVRLAEEAAAKAREEWATRGEESREQRARIQGLEAELEEARARLGTSLGVKAPRCVVCWSDLHEQPPRDRPWLALVDEGVRRGGVHLGCLADCWEEWCDDREEASSLERRPIERAALELFLAHLEKSITEAHAEQLRYEGIIHGRR